MQRTTRLAIDAGRNVPSRLTVTMVPGISLALALKRTPVVEIFTRDASPPTGDNLTPVIDGKSDAWWRSAIRLSSLWRNSAGPEPLTLLGGCASAFAFFNPGNMIAIRRVPLTDLKNRTAGLGRRPSFAGFDSPAI